MAPRGVKLGINLALQPDGKIVLAGLGFRVVRLTAEGRLDSTFGDGGVSSFAQRRRASDVALQPDGAIVVAGYVGRFDRKFLVMRLNTDGTPDEEFGGDGSKRTNIGPV